MLVSREPASSSSPPLGQPRKLEIRLKISERQLKKQQLSDRPGSVGNTGTGMDMDKDKSRRGSHSFTAFFGHGPSRPDRRC